MKPEQAWRMALGQLQMEMPKAAFDTWVRDAELVSYEDGTFIVGLPDAYARDWLDSRLSSTVSRLLTGIMNRPVEVHFIVWESADASDAEYESSGDVEDQQLKVRVAHQSLRDALTEPHKVVVIPGYFRRWVPFLGPTLSWIVVAFRQVMYLGTHHKARTNLAFRTSPQQVARWAGIARNTLWRNLKDHRLRWFLKQPNPDKHVYEFIATMPLTPGDAEQLQDFLVNAGAQSDPITALQTALNTPVSQIWPNPLPTPKDNHLEMEPRPRSVQNVVLDACGTVKASQFKRVAELADQLAAYLLPPNNVIIVSHYFLLNWVKQLGAAPAWLVTLLRDQCYISKDEIRNTVWVHGGDPEIAQMLGLCRPKTISEWLTPLEDSRFERPLRPPPAPQGSNAREERTQRRELKRCQVRHFVERIHYLDQSENTAWQFKVNLVEPLIPENQAEYDRAMALIEAFLATGNLDLLREMLASGGANGTNEGAFGTDGGANGTSSPEVAARLRQVAARMEQTEGAFGTDGGANGTDCGRVWNALSSLNLLKAPMLNLLQHLENISTSTSTSTESNVENIKSERLVLVGDLLENWNLRSLLSTSQLHPVTRKKLAEWEIDSWILVSHMLYAHSRNASNVQSPMAIVGSALMNDPQNGFGGHYDVLAQLPPRELAGLIKRAHDFAIQYPSDYYHNWQSGNQAWDIAMEKTGAEQLRSLAVRLGVAEA
jgi:hypothetical protein